MRHLIIILTAVVCFVAPAMAEEAIFVGVYTRHIDYRSELNENNQIVGIKYGNYFATTFVNSQYDRTHFIGWLFDTDRKILHKELYLKGNLYAGMSYGYEVEFNVGGWYPAAAPSFELGIKNWSLEFIAWPADGGVVISLLNYKF
jgi:hypothetical protein